MLQFVRAYQYFGLVKYYGGVPLILTIQEKPVPTPRNKEEEVWDQIKADLESAISLMDETMPNAN